MKGETGWEQVNWMGLAEHNVQWWACVDFQVSWEQLLDLYNKDSKSWSQAHLEQDRYVTYLAVRVCCHCCHLMGAVSDEWVLQINIALCMCLLFLEHCIFCLCNKDLIQLTPRNEGLEAGCAPDYLNWGSENWVMVAWSNWHEVIQEDRAVAV